jgi:hypothetical protein
LMEHLFGHHVGPDDHEECRKLRKQIHHLDLFMETSTGTTG